MFLPGLLAENRDGHGSLPRSRNLLSEKGLTRPSTLYGRGRADIHHGPESVTPLEAEYIGADQLPLLVFRLQLCGGPYIPIIRLSGTGIVLTYRVWSCIDLFELTAAMEHQHTPPLMSNGFLLLVQECVEHGLLDVHFVRASVWIDEGIPGTLLELRVLFLQVVLGRVVAERHVACERTH